jgi:hypothetical protein
VDISSDGPEPHGDVSAAVKSACVDPASADAGGAIVNDSTNGGCAQDLPMRPNSGRQLERKIRPLDDPEILQRVLAGLLRLQ